MREGVCRWFAIERTHRSSELRDADLKCLRQHFHPPMASPKES